MALKDIRARVIYSSGTTLYKHDLNFPENAKKNTFALLSSASKDCF